MRRIIWGIRRSICGTGERRGRLVFIYVERAHTVAAFASNLRDEASGFPFAEDELCPEDAFEDLAPDDEHFHEATGNEGASFERTYRRAGFVLWPAARR